jgi:hypothetical protein
LTTKSEERKQITEMDEAVRTPLEIRVACHAGYRSEEEPRRLWLDDCVVHVSEILDRWITPDYRYFKVLGDDGRAYVLRHDTRGEFWELTMFDRLSPSMRR